jgi:hypothetical protein
MMQLQIYLSYLMALIHDPSAQLAVRLAIAVIGLAAALLKVGYGACVLFAAALAWRAAGGSHRQDTPQRPVPMECAGCAERMTGVGKSALTNDNQAARRHPPPSARSTPPSAPSTVPVTPKGDM